MAVTALFHLGMPKTGTSLLQNVMHLATVRGPVRGVLFPAFGRNGQIAHHALPEALRRGDDPAALARTLLDDLAAERAAGKRFRIALYSSEGFTNQCGQKPAPQMAAFLEGVAAEMPVRSVLILRELTSFLESMYLQSTRYGFVAQDFKAYLGPRARWWSELLAGLALLRERLGPAFEVRLAEPGFDVLTDFSARLSLPIERLQAFARRVPPTGKLSWKAQVVLANLAAVEQRVGFPINRLALVRAFQRGLSFREDLESYTLYAPCERTAIAARLSAMAAEGGLPDYAHVFDAAVIPESTAPHVQIDLAALHPADIQKLRRARPRIAADAATAAV